MIAAPSQPRGWLRDDERVPVKDYDALRYYLKQQTLAEFVLTFEEIEDIIDASLPRAAQRASWWETLRSPQEKMPQREACLAGGYLAMRLADGKSVRFKRVTAQQRRARQAGEDTRVHGPAVDHDEIGARALRFDVHQASAPAIASTRRSMSLSVCNAVNVMRRRAVPSGTVGGRIAGT